MKSYLVGGAVRDELLGLEVRERDWVVVGATEEEMLARGFRPLHAAFPVFLHPESGDEYALARRERKVAPGYKGFEVDAGPDVTLEEDLARRDLTVNALARDGNGALIDLYHGREDLDAGILRHVTPAFEQDPVRLLRAARFAARFGRWGFRLAHGTFDLMRKMAGLPELSTLWPDRLRGEMHKALATEQPWRFFDILHRCGALERLIPPLAAAMGPVKSDHAGGGLSPPLAALERASKLTDDPALRFAVVMSPAFPMVAEVERFCARLATDSASRNLLELVVDWPVARVVHADARQMLTLLEEARLLHRSERLEQLRLIWSAQDLQQGEWAVRRLERALEVASSVRADHLIASGCKGPELGRLLRSQRLEAIMSRLDD